MSGCVEVLGLVAVGFMLVLMVGLIIHQTKLVIAQEGVDVEEKCREKNYSLLLRPRLRDPVKLGKCAQGLLDLVRDNPKRFATLYPGEEGVLNYPEYRGGLATRQGDRNLLQQGVQQP